MKNSERLGVLAADALASVVVFLVALPLCLGVALASGAPPALGLVTGIVGGLLVGAVQGTPFSVSGPAAGLTVIVFEIVREHGLAYMSTVVLAAGALQIVSGVLGGGRWFRAVPPAVVHGMLAGIGLLLAAGQAHVLLGDKSRGGGVTNLFTLPDAVRLAVEPVASPGRAGAAAIGALTIGLLAAWPGLAPKRLRVLPAPLVAVGVATTAAHAFGLSVAHVEVPARLLSTLALPDATTIERLTSTGLWLAAVQLALVASAETLLCTAAVDRMHTGPRSSYNRELVAQGIGNSACGILGALPMTAVIVRSTTNLRAGARTRASTMLHGAFLLLLAVAAPQLLRLVPVASLAAVLVFVGVQLIDTTALAELARVGRSEAAIFLVTMTGVVAIDLLRGVFAGLAVAALVLFHRLTHLRVDVEHDDGGRSVVHLHGSATFMRLPKLAEALEGIPPDRELHVRLDGLAHVDHAALELLANWERVQRERGTAVVIDLSDHPVTAKMAEGGH